MDKPEFKDYEVEEMVSSLKDMRRYLINEGFDKSGFNGVSAIACAVSALQQVELLIEGWDKVFEE